jgi:hypothetical protein
MDDLRASLEPWINNATSVKIREIEKIEPDFQDDVIKSWQSGLAKKQNLIKTVTLTFARFEKLRLLRPDADEDSDSENADDTIFPRFQLSNWCARFEEIIAKGGHVLLPFTIPNLKEYQSALDVGTDLNLTVCPQTNAYKLVQALPSYEDLAKNYFQGLISLEVFFPDGTKKNMIELNPDIFLFWLVDWWPSFIEEVYKNLAALSSISLRITSFRCCRRAFLFQKPKEQ